MELFKSTGRLKYDMAEYGYKLIVEADRGLAAYYKSLIPKWIETKPQKYPAHISVVRKEAPSNLEVWGKYDGESIEFTYSNIVHRGQVYFWLNVFCTRLEEIRLELGLPVSSEYTKPPDGWVKCFHLTLANCKP